MPTRFPRARICCSLFLTELPTLLSSSTGTEESRWSTLAFLNRYNLSMEFVLDQKPVDFLNRDCLPAASHATTFSALSLITRSVVKSQWRPARSFLSIFTRFSSHARETDSLVCYVKDITEQKKLESKIQHTEKIASIGQLAAGIAHEINNPLGVILCHIDLIKGDRRIFHQKLEPTLRLSKNMREIAERSSPIC